MNVLIDTCVFLDLLQERKPFFKDAHGVLLSAANREINGFLTAKALTDLYYLTHRATHSDAETRKVLSKLLTVFHLLNTAAIDCQKALLSDISDFEDAVMIETALREGMDCIVTRNAKDYVKSPIKVFSPTAFLKQLREND